MSKDNEKDNVDKKWWLKINWKWVWICILILIIISMSNDYNILNNEYQNYQLETHKRIYELGLNITSLAYELGLNLRSEYSKLDCYEKGSVYCSKEPCVTKSCSDGYSLACIKD